MASDGPDPPPCNQHIYHDGQVVLITAEIGGSNAVEAWVRKIAERSGQPVDWHFCGGRVVVKALGDMERVRNTLSELMPEHDAMKAAVHDCLEQECRRMKLGAS